MKELPAMESIMQQYRRTIWNKFTKAIRDFHMIAPNDRIAVCISGGKASALLAKCIEKYQKIGEVPFSYIFLYSDSGISKEKQQALCHHADVLGFHLERLESDLLQKKMGQAESAHPCDLCETIRQEVLCRAALERGCQKIAFGYHFDDVIETILTGVLYHGQIQTIMPKLQVHGFDEIEQICPLYYVRENDITDWANENALPFLSCACAATTQKQLANRQNAKEWIRAMQPVNPDIAHHIFRSIWNVDLRHLISYHCGETYHHFLDDEIPFEKSLYSEHLSSDASDMHVL